MPTPISCMMPNPVDRRPLRSAIRRGPDRPAYGLGVADQPAAAHRLEALRARIPAVEGHAARLEAPPLGRAEHGREAVVLGRPVAGLIVDAVVDRGDPIAIGPGRRNEVDAPDDGLVLARSVSVDRLDLLGIGLVRCEAFAGPLPRSHAGTDRQ